MARRRKASLDTADAVVAADEIEVLPDSVEEQDGAPVAAESEIVAQYHEEIPEKPATKWIVLEDQVVSLFGQMTLLPAGTVVSVASYGPLGIKRIMEQGVMLEPVG